MPRIFILFSILFLAGCAGLKKDENHASITFPLLSGWHEGQKVYYITTDVSVPEMAQAMNANHAPRLLDAIPEYPKPPGLKTVLERVYGFPNGEQKTSVFASMPAPLGYTSQDQHYSPVWIMWTVEWLQPDKVTELRSEESIFQAEDKGWVKLTRTNVVVNCPVVGIGEDTFLPKTRAFIPR